MLACLVWAALCMCVGFGEGRSVAVAMQFPVGRVARMAATSLQARRVLASWPGAHPHVHRGVVEHSARPRWAGLGGKLGKGAVLGPRAGPGPLQRPWPALSAADPPLSAGCMSTCTPHDEAVNIFQCTPSSRMLCSAHSIPSTDQDALGDQKLRG